MESVPELRKVPTYSSIARILYFLKDSLLDIFTSFEDSCTVFSLVILDVAQLLTLTTPQ